MVKIRTLKGGVFDWGNRFRVFRLGLLERVLAVPRRLLAEFGCSGRVRVVPIICAPVAELVVQQPQEGGESSATSSVPAMSLRIALPSSVISLPTFSRSSFKSVCVQSHVFHLRLALLFAGGGSLSDHRVASRSISRSKRACATSLGTFRLAISLANSEVFLSNHPFSLPSRLATKSGLLRYRLSNRNE